METVRYPVEDSVGLVLAVTPSGAKSWQYWCRGSDTERWAWRTLASYPEMTFAQARKEHQKLCRRLAGYLLAFIKMKYGRRQS